MKIEVRETYVEADARELRESNTLAGNLANILSRCFRSTEPFEEDYCDEEDERREDETDRC